MGNLRGVFSKENTPESHTKTHKSSLSPYKQISVGERWSWLRMTNALILCDLVWKVQNSHAGTEKVALTTEHDWCKP